VEDVQQGRGGGKKLQAATRNGKSHALAGMA